MCVQVDKVDVLSIEICKTNTGTMQQGPDSPFILIWGWVLTVWSTLTGLDWESKRGLFGGFCNQALASYIVTQSICFIVRVWGGGERAVNASKRQNLPPQHHHCSSISWPTASRPSKPQPWHRMSDCSRKCFRGAVKVYTMGVRGNDLRCCRAALTVQEFGAQWVKIQVQVIAGWMGDRQPGEMRIRLTLWSEDQEAFIALEQWLVMTGHSSLESFSHFSVKTLFLNSAMFFISFLSSSRFKNQRV